MREEDEKLKICPNGFHSNGNPDCHCGEKEGWVKRFEEKFGSLDQAAKDEIRYFILQEKESYSQDLIEKIEGIKEKKLFVSRDVFPEELVGKDVSSVFNYALSTIQEMIKEDNE